MMLSEYARELGAEVLAPPDPTLRRALICLARHWRNLADRFGEDELTDHMFRHYTHPAVTPGEFALTWPQVLDAVAAADRMRAGLDDPLELIPGPVWPPDSRREQAIDLLNRQVHDTVEPLCTGRRP